MLNDLLFIFSTHFIDIHHEEYILSPDEAAFYEKRSTLAKVFSILLKQLNDEAAVYELIPTSQLSTQDLENIAARFAMTQKENETLLAVAKRILVKNRQDKQDGEQIIIGATKGSAKQPARVVHCAVLECGSLGMYKCLCDGDFPVEHLERCLEQGFCDIHGPGHSKHYPHSYKSIVDHELLNTTAVAQKKAADKTAKIKAKKITQASAAAALSAQEAKRAASSQIQQAESNLPTIISAGMMMSASSTTAILSTAAVTANKQSDKSFSRDTFQNELALQADLLEKAQEKEDERIALINSLSEAVVSTASNNPIMIMEAQQTKTNMIAAQSEMLLSAVEQFATEKVEQILEAEGSKNVNQFSVNTVVEAWDTAAIAQKPSFDLDFHRRIGNSIRAERIKLKGSDVKSKIISELNFSQYKSRLPNLLLTYDIVLTSNTDHAQLGKEIYRLQFLTAFADSFIDKYFVK